MALDPCPRMLVTATSLPSSSSTARSRTSCTPPARRQGLEALLTVALGCWWGNPDQATRNGVVAVANRLAPPDEPHCSRFWRSPIPSTAAAASPNASGRRAPRKAATRWRCFTWRTQPRAFGRTTWPSRFSRRPSTASAPTDDSGSTRTRSCPRRGRRCTWRTRGSRHPPRRRADAYR